MENQPTKLDKVVKVGIVAGALIVALSVAYYLVIYIPQREKEKIEQQKQVLEFQDQKQKSEEARVLEDKRESALNELSRKMEIDDCINKAKDEMNNTEKIWASFQKKNCPDGTNSELTYQCLSTVRDRLKEAVAKFDQAEKDCYLKFPQK